MIADLSRGVQASAKRRAGGGAWRAAEEAGAEQRAVI